jgi:hypothetical protein
VPNPHERRTTAKIEPPRLRLILRRLRTHFYETPPASERIAGSVAADLKALKESRPTFPH